MAYRLLLNDTTVDGPVCEAEWHRITPFEALIRGEVIQGCMWVMRQQDTLKLCLN